MSDAPAAEDADTGHDPDMASRQDQAERVRYATEMQVDPNQEQHIYKQTMTGRRPRQSMSIHSPRRARNFENRRSDRLQNQRAAARQAYSPGERMDVDPVSLDAFLPGFGEAIQELDAPSDQTRHGYNAETGRHLRWLEPSTQADPDERNHNLFDYPYPPQEESSQPDLFQQQVAEALSNQIATLVIQEPRNQSSSGRRAGRQPQFTGYARQEDNYNAAASPMDETPVSPEDMRAMSPMDDTAARQYILDHDSIDLLTDMPID